ncbi:MAG: hypothetical protein IJC09_05755 [Clostridia bacterium]|nr:hypothetical protein [Clostridia bacterium]
MKKVFSLLITLAMLVSTAVVPMSASASDDAWDGTVATGFADGTGNVDDPYLITSAEELAYLASSTYNALSTSSYVLGASAETDAIQMYNAYTGVYFKLMSDIDLADNEWTPIGRMGMRFNGNFDGNGHVIKNLKMTKNYFGMGLFGATGTDAVISKLGINGATFEFYSTENGADCDLKNSADPTSTDASWVAPYNMGATALTRTYGVGAMIGLIGGGDVSDCYAYDVLINNKAGSDHPNSAGFIGGCYAARQYNSSDTTTAATVTNCYVNKLEFTGKTATFESGFCGSLSRGASNFAYDLNDIDFVNCYVGQVTNEHTGIRDAFCDKSSGNGSTSNCYSAYAVSQNEMSVTAVSDVATLLDGLSAGYCADNAKTPLNGGYPILTWQNTWNDTWDGTTPDTDWDTDESGAYLITSAAELAGLASQAFNAISTSTAAPISATPADVTGMYNAYTGVTFKLTKDIDLNDKEWTPIGRAGMRFNGKFDGNGHVIKNLYMSNNYWGMGLFGATGTDVEIANLGIDGANFEFYSKADGAPTYDYMSTLNRTESTDASWLHLYKFSTSDTLDRTHAVGTLVGLISGGEITNCFARNVTINNQGGSDYPSAGGLIGGSYSTMVWDSTSNKTDTAVTNCYVNNVTFADRSKATCAAVLCGSASRNNTSFKFKTRIVFTNCYTGTSTGEKTAFCHNGNSGTSVTISNCYSISTATDSPKSATVVADAVAMSKALITGDDKFCLDNVNVNVNGGYPVLGWERDWTVQTSPMSFYKVTDYADGKVNVIQSDADVTGTVIVAVYDGTRFINAATAKADNGEITVSGLNVEPGNTVKVLVWNSLSGLTPLAAEYSTTVTE